MGWERGGEERVMGDDGEEVGGMMARGDLE